MPNLAKLSLTNHHHCLAEGLKESRNFIPSDLQIICQNGETVDCHQAVFASQCTSQSLIRELKSNPEDLICISVPEISKIHVESLIDILYSGITHQANSLDEINEIHIITELFCFSKIELLSSSSTVENLIPKDFEEENKRELSLVIQEVEEKKKQRSIPNSTTTSKKSKNAKIQESSISALDPGPHFDLDGPRRSKRPRPKNKHLEDYETPYRKTLIKDNETSQLTEELPFINEEYIDKQIEPLANIHRGDQDNVNVLIGSSSMNWKLNFSDEVYKTCYICFYQFFGLHQLTKHLRLHISGPYSCLECSKQVPTGLSLHEHFRNHFKGSIQNDNNIAKTSTITTNKCKECHEDFKSKTGLLKHYAEKHAMITTTKQNMYHCTDCTFICYNAKGFRKHMQERHNKKPFPCQQCGISYNHKANLEDHIKAKHSSKEYPCDKCGKVFNKKASLFVHRREQHELGDSRKIKCDICSLELKGKRNLKKHKETHMNENDLSLKKKYQCLYCQKHFRTRNSVNVHHRTHTGETPYRCHLCSKNFKRSHHLSSHLKCADHLSKIQQQSSNLPQPVYSISKSNDLDFNQHQATTSDVTELIFTVGGDDDDDVCVSKSYQVVVPSELNPSHQHPGTMTTDQLLQSALVLQESTDYQTFATTE